MLTENDISDAIATDLERTGFGAKCSTVQRGIDI